MSEKLKYNTETAAKRLAELGRTREKVSLHREEACPSYGRRAVAHPTATTEPDVTVARNRID